MNEGARDGARMRRKQRLPGRPPPPAPYRRLTQVRSAPHRSPGPISPMAPPLQEPVFQEPRLLRAALAPRPDVTGVQLRRRNWVVVVEKCLWRRSRKLDGIIPFGEGGSARRRSLFGSARPFYL